MPCVREAPQRRGRQAWRCAQGQHLAAQVGDDGGLVQRPEAAQQVTRLAHRAGRWRVEPWQFIGAPTSRLEGEAGKFGMFDLRRPGRVEAAALRPQPVRDALGDTTGATRALVGRRLRDAHCFQTGKPEGGSKRGSRARPESTTARIPGKVTLDSATLVARTTRRVPGSAGANASCCSARGKLAVKGDDLGAFDLPFEHRTRTLDLAAPRQEGKHVAIDLPERLRHDAHEVLLHAVSCGRTGGYSTRTGKTASGLLSLGASSHCAMRSPSSVADITSRRKSGRRLACTSSASAAPRSPRDDVFVELVGDDGMDVVR